MPVLVQNNENNPTVFDIRGGSTLTWRGKGDPMGDDVQRVPDAVLDDVEFLRSIDLGIFTVLETDDPALLEKVQQSGRLFSERRAKAEALSTASIDRQQDRDIVGAICIGPAPAGRSGQCGASVLMRSVQRNEIPPLCARHESLAPQYSRIDTGSKGEGATASREGPVTQEWKRVQIDSPRRS